MPHGLGVEVRGKVKTHGGRHPDDDPAQVEGRRDPLVGRIRERYAIEQGEPQRQVDQRLDRL